MVGYKILSLRIISFSILTILLLNFLVFAVTDKSAVFQWRCLIVFCHFVWELLRFFSLVITFISYSGFIFNFTCAFWKFKLIFNLRMKKGLESLAQKLLFHQSLHSGLWIFETFISSSIIYMAVLSKKPSCDDRNSLDMHCSTCG